MTQLLTRTSTAASKLQDVDRHAHKIDSLPRHSVGIKVWLIHRIAGVGLLIYLLSHIATMSTAMFLGDEAFKITFDVLFHTKIFVFFDILVLAGLVIHGLNGIRLILTEMGIWVTKQKQRAFIYVTLIAAVLLFGWLFMRGFAQAF